MNVLVVSRSFPPSVSGSSSIMHRLIRNGNGIEYIVLRGAMHPRCKRTEYVKSYAIDLPRKLQYLTIFKYVFIPVIVGIILLLLFRYRIKQIIAVYPHANFAIASYWTSIISGIPLNIYIHDLWEEGRMSRFETKVASYFENKIIRHSRNVFVLSEAIEDFIDKKHGISSKYLPHTIDKSALVRRDIEWSPPFYITFIGAIHSMNRSLLVSLAKLLSGDKRFVLNIYTQVPESAVISYGITGDNVKISMIDPEQVPEKLQESHVLYLPFEFDHILKHEIRTLLPTRVFDCIASTRPIIVHAPNEYHISKLVKKYGFAVHESSCKSDMVKNRIDEIINDSELRQRLHLNCEMMIKLHDADLISEEFRKILLKRKDMINERI